MTTHRAECAESHRIGLKGMTEENDIVTTLYVRSLMLTMLSVKQSVWATVQSTSHSDRSTG